MAEAGASESAEGAKRGGVARLLKKHWRIGLLVVGVGAMAMIVRKLGAKSVLATLLAAGPLVPVILLLEATWMGLDVFVLRQLLGAKASSAPWSAYAKSAVAAYSVNILFPAGRTSAEVTRAAMLSRWLGASSVTLAAASLQGSSLLGTAVVTFVAAAAAASRLGVTNKLVVLIASSGLLTAALGSLLLFGARAPRIWAFVKSKATMLPDLPAEASDPSVSLGGAIALSVVARAVQCLLFTTVVYATSGVLSLVSGSIAQGISLAGSTVGDAVPQQAGVAEGAFVFFADALGLGDAPEKAVAIALVVRVCQLMLAGTCLLLGLFFRSSDAKAASPKG